MISCTEFIPAYSELFSYIDDKYGTNEVAAFWKYLFEPTGKGIPLINYVKKEGIRGCFDYWKSTLNEEAADFKMSLNEQAGWFMLKMNHCPSKGRLLKLKDEIGITPYPRYCLHCDYYRSAIERVGLKYIYNFTDVDSAGCSLFIYDPKKFNGQIIVDEFTEIMERRDTDNEYYHPDFHSSMNMGIDYLGKNYGLNAVEEYLVRFTKNVYSDLIKNIWYSGINVIAEKISDTYTKEKAMDALTIVNDGKKLCVSVSYCPAVKHLKSTGRNVSEWYCYTTQTVMETLAKEAGVPFEMLLYDEDTGASKYCFG